MKNAFLILFIILIAKFRPVTIQILLYLFQDFIKPLKQELTFLKLKAADGSQFLSPTKKMNIRQLINLRKK